MKNIGENFNLNPSTNTSGTTRKKFLLQQRQLVIVITLLLLSGCATHYHPAAYSDPYGFFSGIWHGFIFPYALFSKIISWCLSFFGIDVLADIQIIGRPNTGFFFYYIGFVLGLSTYGGASSR